MGGDSEERSLSVFVSEDGFVASQFLVMLFLIVVLISSFMFNVVSF